MELQCFAHERRGSNSGARSFSPFNTKDPLAFETVEVLGEASPICAEIMALHGQHEERVELIERVEQRQKISRIPVCGNCQKVP